MLTQDKRQKRLVAAWTIPLTLVYLAIELPFNARLLDVVGRVSTPADIHHIEIYGRLISGFAVVLLYWGTIEIPRAVHGWSTNSGALGPVLRMIFIGALMGAGVYAAEKALVDYLAEHTTGAQRQLAMKLNLVEGEVQASRLRIDGIPMSPAALASPEGMTFLAVFPFMARYIKDIDQKIDASIKTVVTSHVNGKLGRPAQLYNKAYVPAAKSIVALYPAYRKAVLAYRKAVTRGYAQTSRRLDNYLRRLRTRFRRSYPRIPSYADANIRLRLREQGLAVPRSFRPPDASGFVHYYHRSVIDKARVRFKRRVQSRLHIALSPNLLSERSFYRDKEIQSLWQRRLGLDKADAGLILPDMSLAVFTARVYDPMKQQAIKRILDTIRARQKAFAPGGEYAARGEQAARAMIATPIALIFSVAGALIHLLKLALLIVKLIQPRHCWVSIVGLIAASGVLVIMVFVAGNPVTESRLYKHMSAWMEAPDNGWQGRALATGTTWLIQAEQFVYPANEWLRQELLQGFQYGVAT